MQEPHFLPDHLASYRSFATDEALFQGLVQKLDDLLLFFEYICKDEKWIQEHSKFLRLFLRWSAKQFYLGNLSIDNARRIVKTVQTHYSLLQPFLFFRAALFFTVRLQVENQQIVVNSLLFGVCSPPLRTIFKRECFEKLNDEWILFNVQLPIFRHIETYISTGKLPELWKCEPEEIVALMDQAKAWELEELVRNCATFLRRDIQRDNIS